jgi:hypothetical protein
MTRRASKAHVIALSELPVKTGGIRIGPGRKRRLRARGGKDHRRRAPGPSQRDRTMSLDLDAIRARYNSIQSFEQGGAVWTLTVWRSADDVPALLTEVERMRTVVERARTWRRSNGTHTERVMALVAITDAVDALPCCDLHGRNCEPPSELCCRWCTEVAHGLLGLHSDGSVCSAPDLSGFNTAVTP